MTVLSRPWSAARLVALAAAMALTVPMASAAALEPGDRYEDGVTIAYPGATPPSPLQQYLVVDFGNDGTGIVARSGGGPFTTFFVDAANGFVSPATLPGASPRPARISDGGAVAVGNLHYTAEHTVAAIWDRAGGAVTPIETNASPSLTNAQAIDADGVIWGVDTRTTGWLVKWTPQPGGSYVQSQPDLDGGVFQPRYFSNDGIVWGIWRPDFSSAASPATYSDATGLQVFTGFLVVNDAAGPRAAGFVTGGASVFDVDLNATPITGGGAPWALTRDGLVLVDGGELVDVFTGNSFQLTDLLAPEYQGAVLTGQASFPPGYINDNEQLLLQDRNVGFFIIDPSGQVTTADLTIEWDDALAGGGIADAKTYQQGVKRIEQLEKAISKGNVDDALDKIDGFVDKLANWEKQGKIDAATAAAMSDLLSQLAESLS